MSEPARPVGLLTELVERFERAYSELGSDDHNRFFCGMYLRSTQAVRDEVGRDGFADAAWMAQLATTFASCYLNALQDWRHGRPVARPWQLAFGADPSLSPLVHELVSFNAHLNFDLPRALLAVLRNEDFADRGQERVREADFRHIDTLMLARIPQEYRQLRQAGGPLRQEVVARVLYPLNLMASRRWLVAARRQAWQNAAVLSLARGCGADRLADQVGQLEELAAAKVDELTRPGQVLLRLAVAGFGVQLRWTGSQVGAKRSPS